MIEIVFVLITIIAFCLIGIGQLSNKNINLLAFVIGAMLFFFVGIILQAEGITTMQISKIPVTTDSNGNIVQYSVEYPEASASTDTGVALLSYLYFALGLIFFLIGGVEFYWKGLSKKILGE